MTFEEWTEIFELASYVVIILGVPAALYQYRRKTLREQQDREYGTYNALDEKYLEFVRLCFEHPQLDIFDIPDAQPAPATPKDQKQELIAFTMLFSIFERAYLMYADQSSRIKQRQWSGWLEYITEYCMRENFRRAWRISGNTFDTTFQEFVEGVIRSVTPAGEGADLVAHEVNPGDADQVARVIDLITTSPAAGSFLSSNQLAYLLTSSTDLGLRTTAFLINAPRASGAVVVTAIRNGEVLLLSGVGIQGRDVLSVWHALLRVLANAMTTGNVVAVEAPASGAHVLAATIPGMGGFRELDLPYRYRDGTSAHLWIWTTADGMRRDDAEALLRVLLGDYYAPLFAQTDTPLGEVEGEVRNLLQRARDVIRFKASSPFAAVGG